ncbi:hypothetical protein RvY_00474 [Ramazzottius varieornatus]|uniref:Uncharacterized protein n=1 Tax=Ramazzottius varieornatus TaxID=947166 RepID=A0A1D1UCX4_RAMVA|nr:hypothetical protein RvY_00474 [Ramazzottius varieornatus]
MVKPTELRRTFDWLIGKEGRIGIKRRAKAHRRWNLTLTPPSPLLICQLSDRVLRVDRGDSMLSFQAAVGKSFLHFLRQVNRVSRPYSIQNVMTL